MVDDMPLHNRLDAYVSAFAADNEGLTLTADIWNRLRSDLKEAAMLLSSVPSETRLSGQEYDALVRDAMYWRSKAADKMRCPYCNPSMEGS